MILNEQRKRNRRHKFLTFIGTIVMIIVVIAGIHACGVNLVTNKKNDLKGFAEDFKQNAKEFAPSEEEVREGTKKGIDRVLDFIINGSRFVDENITQPAFEFSNELANEQLKKAESKTEVEFVHVTYWYAVDGDTLKVLTDDNEFVTVRLIGINTPESVASDEYLAQKDTVNSEYGKMASEWTGRFLDENVIAKASEIWLQFDLEREDQYGRLLAYVWISKDVDLNNEEDIENYMLNAQIVKNGYAEDVVYEPNHKYASVFKKLREEAEKSRIGLWQYDDIKEYY